MKYEREYFIHYYDCDNNLKLGITGLLRYFEDIALLQSEDADIGLKYYHKNNVAWVLYKWDISINCYPAYKEKIKVITEPISFARFYAYRSFEVRNQQDEVLVTANSLWFFVDTSTRKPTKIIADMFRGYGIGPEVKKELPIEEIRLPVKTDLQKEFIVRQSDIDLNNHVNNIRYIEWALEMVPNIISQNFTLKRLKVNYKKETHYGRRINSVIEIVDEGDSKTCSHKITDEGEDICFIESQWGEK